MLDITIVVNGNLDQTCSHWFTGLSAEVTSDGAIVFQGALRDQEAVFNILSKLNHLGFSLISFECRETEPILM